VTLDVPPQRIINLERVLCLRKKKKQSNGADPSTTVKSILKRKAKHFRNVWLKAGNKNIEILEEEKLRG
jgi:hypothetical protein